MNLCDEETDNIIIGEAAIHLILNAEDVTLRTLMKTLEVLAENEADDLRVMQIYKARKWLSGLTPPVGISPPLSGMRKQNLMTEAAAAQDRGIDMASQRCQVANTH